MVCLNQSAFEILKAEIQRRCAGSPAGQVQQEIALKRLEKLCTRPGNPLTFEELKDSLNDLFPDFDEKVLRRAAKANCPPFKLLNRVKWGAIALTSMVGGVWVLNLPYPMIRYPVAKTMPIVLLPSFISMDHNYRQAIAATEQADQLVNQATSLADFELGATKVEQAQKHLDALPVWFLGYYPSLYCSWFQCSWQFTLDEFQQARKNVARMQATLYQEKNAQTKLTEAEQAIATAKQQYQQGVTIAQKQIALAQWQQGMDDLRALPSATLAAKTAQTKLAAYERDFQQVAGFTADNVRSGSVIQASKLAAETAQKFSSKPVQTAAEWQEAIKLWEDAIAQINTIDIEDPDYIASRKLLEDYKQNLSSVRLRFVQEKTAVEAYERAQQLTQALIASIPENSKALNRQQVSELQKIITELKKVKPRTTVYAEAQAMLKSAQSKLQK
ncbi:hypothetical protein OsccyDRAFT_2626 [Leptolyngbyaceae cyanobacterium JSC-12]|nr:hypothetical protein OsccyDRAFT_2626 [Leptolyngbyaceae cyanobacterium JSC-12]